MVKDGRARLIRRRETYDDLLACEVPESGRPEMLPAAREAGRPARPRGRRG
jgi:hypothetical protein